MSKLQKFKWLGKNQKAVLNALDDGRFHPADELALACETTVQNIYNAVSSLRFKKHINIICDKERGYAMGNSEHVPLDAHKRYSNDALGQAIGAEKRLLMERGDFKQRLRIESKRGIKDKIEYAACRNVFKRVVEHTIALEMADIPSLKQLKKA